MMINNPQFFLASLCPASGLQDQYAIHCKQPSDINEHLPRLRELASECSSVIEIGVREMVATWALLQGLAESAQNDRSYIAIDLAYPPLITLFLAGQLSEKNGVSFRFWQTNDFGIEIESTDLLFIDSLHTYCHLTYELEAFCPKVRKFIALHDTSEPWGAQDELYQGIIPEYAAHIDRNKRGLWTAVEDFLATHLDWQLKERHFNNHGFTVLERI